MIKNYLIIAWRNLLKSKIFSFINILGLTIGIAVCMMIYLFIMNELSVDKFHKNGNNIYRVMRGDRETHQFASWLSGPYATALLNDYPGEIKSAVRIMPGNALVTFGEHSFNEKKLYITDTGFFTFFSFPLLKGNPSTVLTDPNSVAISESTAKKYFGQEDPMGKVIEIDKSMQMKVTGVFKDVPVNSHLDFDLVIPLTMYINQSWFNTWMDNNNYTYVLLDERADKAELEKKFPSFMDKYLGSDMARMGKRMDLALLPLKDIYFENSPSFDRSKHGDKKVVFIFLSIAIFILLIACINFMNLSTIRAVERSKEVGLRKVLGANRTQLISQFIGESVLLTLISCLLSIGLLELFMPLYSQLLGYSLGVSWNTSFIWMFLIGVILVVGFLAGSYPALFLAGFSPIQALKGKIVPGKAGAVFRQALVVLQFSISVLLIIGTIIIMNQMRYVKNKELGYHQEQTLIIRLDNNDIHHNRRTFASVLQDMAPVESVSLMSGEPGGFYDMHTFEAEGQNETWRSRTTFADFQYVKTLGLKIIAGRDFSPEFATDTTDAVLINRTAAASLGFTPEQAVGKWLRNTLRDQNKRTIIGVVEDFNFLSLKEKMDALVISPSEDRRLALIRLKPGNIKAGIEAVKEVYNKVAPLTPFEYSFLDENFDILYKTDLRQQKILSIFSGLAIFIACLGLFGLASFTATQRTREIGIRKVLGSTVQNIVILLSRDLLKPVLIATFIAIPAGYYIMYNWLQNFAYRTSMHWWVFVIAALVTFSIAVFTVSLKAVKAAVANPIKSLRNE